MMEGGHDLYDILDVPRDASQDEIREAFHQSSRRRHPDNGADSAFRRTHKAYHVLSDDVLRTFYDRYGMTGIRLAEGLSDNGEEGSNHHLGLPENRLSHLEESLQRLTSKHKELRMPRRLALQGSFVLSLASAPGHHGAHFRRRYHIHYSAVSQSVQLSMGDRVRLIAGGAAHIQGSNGLGAAKLMIALAGKLGASAHGRCEVNLVGGSLVQGDASIEQKLSQSCSAQQKISVSADGSYTLKLGLFPWLSNALQGRLECAFGDQHAVSLGLIKRSLFSRYKLSASLNLQPGFGELNMHAKVKPSKDFSFTVSPGISPNGLMLVLDCSKSFQDGLTKLHWILRVRQRGASLRLVLKRAGLQFAFPIELWPDSSGLLPASELLLAIAMWALPPLVFRLLLTTSFAWGGWSRSTAVAPQSNAVPPTSLTKIAIAEEQRQLLAPAAARKRHEEASRAGLEILVARYGDPKVVKENEQSNVLDVTDCLMAWVRASRLELSEASKSSLIGFHDEKRQNGAAFVLYVRYRFGQVEHERIFGDTDIVLLP